MQETLRVYKCGVSTRPWPAVHSFCHPRSENDETHFGARGDDSVMRMDDARQLTCVRATVQTEQSDSRILSKNGQIRWANVTGEKKAEICFYSWGDLSELYSVSFIRSTLIIPLPLLVRPLPGFFYVWAKWTRSLVGSRTKNQNVSHNLHSTALPSVYRDVRYDFITSRSRALVKITKRVSLLFFIPCDISVVSLIARLTRILIQGMADVNIICLHKTIDIRRFHPTRRRRRNTTRVHIGIRSDQILRLIRMLE